MTAATHAPTPTGDRTGQSVKARLNSAPWPELAAPIGLVVIFIVFSLMSSDFFTSGTMNGIVQASSILIVLAVGQTFVIATGGIDLSVASTMTFAAVMLGIVYTATDSITLASLAAVATGALAGAVNGIIVAKGRITDFVVTLGSLSAFSGLALVFADGKPVTITDKFLLNLASKSLGPIPWLLVVALVVAVIAHFVLFRTRFGLHVLATGGSVEAARTTGVRTDRVKIAVYLISGLLAGIAAIMLVARVGSAEPASNTSFLLNSVAAVVLGGVSLIGGRATIISPVLGGVLLQALNTGLTQVGLTAFYQPIAVGVVVIFAAFLTRFSQ